MPTAKIPAFLLTKPFDGQPPPRYSPEDPAFRASHKFAARLKPGRARNLSSPPAMSDRKSLPAATPGGFGFRRRAAVMPTPVASPGPATGSPASRPHGDDVLLFPTVYEDAWGGSDTTRTDMERARIFLFRIASMSSDQAINTELRDIVGNRAQYRSVPALAFAIKTRLYGDRHADFAATPLLQAVRFMLIKARVPEVAVSDRSRAVIDFFFDPTLQRNLSPLPPGALVRHKYPSGRLRVCIVGGGPTGLASAISLAEKGAGKVEVHVYERRWVVTDNGTVDYPPTAKRRDQVVTLQDSVTSLLSKASYQALFEGRPEHVWPGSANIQIRKVEDRFLERCQADDFRGLIHLHAEGVTREELAAGKCGDFHVLLGTDGAASWVRSSYFRGYEKERGRSFALGLAFDRGAKAGLPWSQSLNMFLTLGQTRYLLNASDFDGRGYLNMQLTEDEWDKMVSADGQPIHFGRPACLRRPDGSVPEGFDESRVFAPSEDRNSPLWKSIEDGLKLFGFKENEVINVVRIPIVVQAVREGVQQLPLEDSRSVKRPHALVAVAGDAAMTVHFWPGRGLNSGIKSGISLGDEIVHALNSGRFAGLELGAMKQYNEFILRLQGREHDKRSIPILNQSGSPETLGWLLSKAHTVPDEVAVEWLVGAMTQIADRLERRSDWAFPHEANIEAQIRIVLRQLHSQTLREMAVSFPWPTREMAGAEVLPIRSMKPEEKQKWLQQLWGLLSTEKNKDQARPRSVGPAPSSGRFEAPRAEVPRAASRSPSPNPMSRSPGRDSDPPVIPPVQRLISDIDNMLLNPTSASLRRSNAKSNRLSLTSAPSARARRLSTSSNLCPPDTHSENDRYMGSTSGGGFGGGEDRQGRPRAASMGASGGDVGLTRLLSVKRPTGSVLSEAMALALFRVDED